ncbi:unnamed protein product [Gongylonema pulchrum]|uniref:Peptidylamidoglycolate lyase n=1 Tax=Gongylonema pulchrum TaxID=637853 RepID=A0A183CVR1_9BILA|nr:unnamed protein product [Gongylonema pulchrum]
MRSNEENIHRSFDERNRFNASAGPIKNATVYVIDPRSGKVVDEFGKGSFYMPHGLAVDGSDNIWLTDIALHQAIFQFRLSGEIFILGNLLHNNLYFFSINRQQLTDLLEIRLDFVLLCIFCADKKCAF